MIPFEKLAIRENTLSLKVSLVVFYPNENDMVLQADVKPGALVPG
jgi:hypothetical protein